jgi:hypothetical protein
VEVHAMRLVKIHMYANGRYIGTLHDCTLIDAQNACYAAGRRFRTYVNGDRATIDMYC